MAKLLDQQAVARETGAMTGFLTYGTIHPDLAEVPAGARQISPIIPGSVRLDNIPAGSCDGLVMVAPPGSLERRHDVARALEALKPGAPYILLAPKDRGGARLGKELRAFGCDPSEDARRHHKICSGTRPVELTGLADALAEGGPQMVAETGTMSRPGLFSWDRLDPGTALLIETLPALAGTGADLGVGYGALSKAVLASSRIVALHGIDVDWRACAAAEANIGDTRFSTYWRNLAVDGTGFDGLDFVITNPPFHATGREDRGLGQTFIEQASKSIRRGGRAYVVANRHLPYETVLTGHFLRWDVLAEQGGYKVIEAVK
jgi:16S rRNA (guanine1207-N2)-methyltransferase